MADKPADEAAARAREWAEAQATVADGIPLEVAEAKTPRPENTGRHRLTPAQFASAVELSENDGYARGLEHGRKLERADAQADAVTEHRKVREDAIEAFRSLWIIFELGPEGKPAPTWEDAQRWARSRMTPI